ncbi:MAG: FAD-dependent oxidoreductase [Thermodesulfobacteriota bacterium]
MRVEIVVIGNGPAAFKAFQTIAAYRAESSTDEMKITVVSQERTPAYSPMFLLGYLAGELREEEILLRDSHGLFLKRLLGEKVIKVQDSKNRIILGSGKEIGYDRLLIASGASPLIPALKGINKKGVYFFNRLEDVRKLSKQLPSTQNIIIIGAGAVGIEVAIALKKLGRNVLIIELLDQILPQVLDKELAEYFKKKLSSSGIKLLLGESVSEVTGNDKAMGIIVGNKEIEGDLILVTTGVKPNVDFLEFSNVKVNTGILVNGKMQTSVPNIYAAGDVVESLDPYGGYELVFNWYNAIDQAVIAGNNLIGVENTYKTSPGLTVIKGADPPVISVGRKYGDEGYEILSYTNTNKQRGFYEKIFVRNNRMDCYQAIGISDKISLIYSYIKGRKDVRRIKSMLGGNYGPAHLWS